jgi:predicted component of type VI protein secretion system
MSLIWPIIIMRYGIKKLHFAKRTSSIARFSLYSMHSIRQNLNRILNGAQVTNRHNPADGIKFKCI